MQEERRTDEWRPLFSGPVSLPPDGESSQTHNTYTAGVLLLVFVFRGDSLCLLIPALVSGFDEFYPIFEAFFVCKARDVGEKDEWQGAIDTFQVLLSV